MSYESPDPNALIKEFYDECYRLLDNQVFKLADRKKQLCAMQAVRHYLAEIYRTHGKWVVLKIINAKSGDEHDLQKGLPLTSEPTHELPKDVDWFGD